MRIALLNTAIMTEFGEYSYRPIDVENAKRLIESRGFESYIGHPSTAEIMSSILGVRVSICRSEYKQQGGMTALVFKLNTRLDTPRELTLDEIEEIGYTLGTLTRVA